MTAKNTSRQSSPSRRGFLQSAGMLAAAASAGPLILRSRLLGADAPSKKIGIGMIGLGRQAMASNLPPFLKSPDCQVLAVCDVDSWRLEQGKAAVEKYYGKQAAAGTYKGCQAYHDFRELLARPDIDAVMISTPDHWHVVHAIAAVKAGKDVALEKPITRTINEGRILADLVVKHKRVFRVDSEFRSLQPMHRAVELVRNGFIGKIKTIRTGSPKEVFPNEPEDVTQAPPELDYNFWLGPAPEVPYIQKRVHTPHDVRSRPGWMRNLDYCDGMITNWGTHLNDIAQWGNNTERTGPVEIKASGKFHEGKVWNVLESFEAWFRFANGVELFYTMAQPFVRFEGELGWVNVNYGAVKLAAERITASSPEILNAKIPDNGVHFPLRSEKEDFIECVKTRGRTLEDEEVGQRTTSMCHLAHISIQLGNIPLKWNPDKEQFVDNDAANKLVYRSPLRAPWTLE